MILGLLTYAYTLSSLAFAFSLLQDWFPPDRTVWGLAGIAMSVVVAPAIALAIYGVLPSTRKHFAETREARAPALVRT
jgi:hypothetical protein